MPPKDKNLMFENHINEGQSATPANAQDQTLLKALQDFIVPLIRVVNQKSKNDINQIPLGPEARELITALQKFISSIVVRSQSGAPNTIEVSLGEEENELQDLDDSGEIHDDGEEDDSSSEGDSLLGTSSESEGDAASDNDSEDLGASVKPQPTFHDKLLKALQEHVFNTMPIRLLCFEPNGSSLQITLLERGVVYARLASALRTNMHEEDHLPEFNESSGTTETDHEAIKRLISRYTRYAILSHTWLRTTSGEVNYRDWNKGLVDTKDLGYQKLVNFCKTAWKDHGLAFGWMDTVCINKESSSELDESIRSMYNWYRRADICIVYLAETINLRDMLIDPWFTRGWTLQELLAPSVIKFYNSGWKRLVKDSDNDKTNPYITKQIEGATTITEDELYDIHDAPISRRMQLAANREVTREEDTAYSLMGIFAVSISTAYGEGARRAFSRLVEEILISSKKVLDIFNWAGEIDDEFGVRHSLALPPSPRYYLHRSSNKNLLHLPVWPMEPLTLTHLGLHTTVLLMPGISIQGGSPASQCNPIGDFKATVEVSVAGIDNLPTSYSLLDNRISGPDGWKKGTDLFQITLAVFSFQGNRDSIRILKTCLAACMRCFEDAGKITTMTNISFIATHSPIVFELSRTTVDPDDDDRSTDGNKSNVDSDSTDDDEDQLDEDNDDDDSFGSVNHWDQDMYYEVKRNDLAKHGIQLVSLYL